MIPRFVHTHKKETIWVYLLQNTLFQVSGYAKDDKLTFRTRFYLQFLRVNQSKQSGQPKQVFYIQKTDGT